MNLNDQEMLSDESDDDGIGESREEMIYRRKYQMLLERCEVLQQDNERLVHRIQQVYKYTRQIRKEKKFLIDRLDNYGDNWRQGISQYFYEDNAQYIKPVSKLKGGEKRVKKSITSAKRPIKDKTESDMSARKQAKENSTTGSSSKSCSKNVSGYNFL